MSEFPLCKKLGLDIFNARDPLPFHLLNAQDVELLLEKAPMVFADIEPQTAPIWLKNSVGEESRYSARLLMIEPIQKDTAEHLLHQLILASENTLVSDPNIWNIIKRAKILLDGTIVGNGATT